MATTEPTSEEDLASLLPDEPELFIRLLYEDYRSDLVACIGKHGWGVFNEHDIADVFQTAMLAVWNKVREPAFLPAGPLKMVFTIARNKAVTARRKKLRLKKIGCNETDVTDLVISDMHRSDLGVAYRLAGEEEKQRLDEALPEIVAALPERQKLAVVAFLECYKEIREKNKHRLLADVMMRMTGEVVDVAAARSALRAGLKKIKNELHRRGIKFVEGSDL